MKLVGADLSTIQFKEVANKMENESAQEILRWALDTYTPRIALASSFGAEDVTLIDMMTKIDIKKTKVFTLDTGRLNQETYNVIDEIRKKYNIQPELAFGAIGEDGVRILNDDVVRAAHLDGDDMDAVERKQRIELRRRAERFRRGRERISLTGRIAVIIDDGIATGATAKAACQVARAHGASRVVLAVPIGPDDIVARFAGYADEVVCLETPAFFFAVGQGYRNFSQTSDDEVVALLDRARRDFAEAAAIDAAADPPLRDEEVQVLAANHHGRIRAWASAAHGGSD